MLKIALVVLFAKFGVGLLAFGDTEIPFMGLAQFGYLALLIGFFYLAIVGLAERVLGWLEPEPPPRPMQPDQDDNLIDSEWLNQVLSSYNQETG